MSILWVTEWSWCNLMEKNFIFKMIENQIINKAIDFIFSHIDEELSVERIADFCGYSKFYLSRLFKAETGEGIYAFIKRVKIEESAWLLKVEQKRSITEIAGDYGYSASNYATMFRDYFKKTPAQRKGSKALPPSSENHQPLYFCSRRDFCGRTFLWSGSLCQNLRKGRSGYRHGNTRSQTLCTGIPASGLQHDWLDVFYFLRNGKRVCDNFKRTRNCNPAHYNLCILRSLGPERNLAHGSCNRSLYSWNYSAFHR